MASEFAWSEVFSSKKTKSRTNKKPLQSSAQLIYHESHSEARAVLDEWMSSKLQLDLEIDEDLTSPPVKNSAAPLTSSQPTTLDNNNFKDLYKHLAEEDEHGAVTNLLLGTSMMKELLLDNEQMRDPIMIMDARHQQVRENRVLRDAERQRQQRGKDAQREAKRREREEERKRQEVHKYMEAMKHKMGRLRQQMKMKKDVDVEKLSRPREQERLEGLRAARSLQSGPPHPVKLQPCMAEQIYEEEVKSMVHMQNLKCLQSHFSRWFSVVLNQRLHMEKAMALCEWKKKLRAWRAWRKMVRAEQSRREVENTQEELRAENRRWQLATESEQRRLLQRCFNEWQLWCRMEREKREILAQKREINEKMVTLIAAVSTGKVVIGGAKAHKTKIALQETLKQPEATEKENHHKLLLPTPDASPAPHNKTPGGARTQLTEPRRAKQHCLTPTATELHKAQQKCARGSFVRSKGATAPDSGFEHRHAVQQQIITEQRRLIKEQQQQISQLKDEQKGTGLEVQQPTQLLFPNASKPKSHNSESSQQRGLTFTEEPDSHRAPVEKAVTHHICPHPIITAMEERARQRSERKREIEELKRKKQETKLAEMKAADEQRQREEEEEKRRAAERRKEEKRQERQKDEEKQRQLKRLRELQGRAQQHYKHFLLLRCGVAPWKRFIQLRRSSIQLAESHHNLILLSRFTLSWQQSARESVSRKEASADQLHQHILLQRSLSCWKRLMEWRMHQTERAERFHHTHLLRKVLRALCDHATLERWLEFEHRERAQKHLDSQLLQRCFLAWTQFPCLLQQERERAERREKLGRKVAEVLPNFGFSPNTAVE